VDKGMKLFNRLRRNLNLSVSSPTSSPLVGDSNRNKADTYSCNKANQAETTHSDRALQSATHNARDKVATTPGFGYPNTKVISGVDRSRLTLAENTQRFGYQQKKVNKETTTQSHDIISMKHLSTSSEVNKAILEQDYNTTSFMISYDAKHEVMTNTQVDPTSRLHPQMSSTPSIASHTIHAKNQPLIPFKIKPYKVESTDLPPPAETLHEVSNEDVSMRDVEGQTSFHVYDRLEEEEEKKEEKIRKVGHCCMILRSGRAVMNNPPTHPLDNKFMQHQSCNILSM
jgi:hypothetical protein